MVSTIGKESFASCSSLESISVGSKNYDYDSRDNCNAIIETNTNTLFLGCVNSQIPNTVTSIGDYAFYNQLKLTSVTIPYWIKSIGDSSFWGCDNLSSVKVENSTPPLCANNAFRYAYQIPITLEVPMGSLSAYQNADVWGRFKNIIEYEQNSSCIETVDSYHHTEETIYSMDGKQLGTIPSKGMYIRDGHKILKH